MTCCPPSPTRGLEALGVEAGARRCGGSASVIRRRPSSVVVASQLLGFVPMGPVPSLRSRTRVERPRPASRCALRRSWGRRGPMGTWGWGCGRPSICGRGGLPRVAEVVPAHSQGHLPHDRGGVRQCPGAAVQADGAACYAARRQSQEQQRSERSGAMPIQSVGMQAEIGQLRPNRPCFAKVGPNPLAKCVTIWPTALQIVKV